MASTMKSTSFLRYIGNTLLVIGHFTLLWGSTEPALMIKIVGGSLILPFAIGLGLWDVVLLELVYGYNKVVSSSSFLVL